MRFPNHVKGVARVELGREWGKRSATKRKPVSDWHSIELRAAHDAKGQVLREGCDYEYGQENNWQTRRSIAGRIDQLDLLTNGQPCQTSGARKLPRRFRP
jgi:hypothetical protein